MRVLEIKNYSEIVQYWMEKVLENRGRDAEASLKFCQDLIKYGSSIEDDALMGFGHYYSGETYYLLNDGTRFFEEISKALSHLDKAKEWELVGRCYNFLGIWGLNRGNIPVALDYYLNGIGYCQKYGLHDIEAVMNINVGAMNNQCKRYREAQAYLERAIEYLREHPELENYHTNMAIALEDLAKSLIFQEKYEEVEDTFYHIYQDHWKHISEADQFLVWCVEAIYYNAIGDLAKCNQRINQVQKTFSTEMPILDMFEDLFSYMQLLLERDKDDELWAIVSAMESMISNCDVIHMQLKLLSIKITYYRKHGNSAEFLQATGLYYELSQVRDRETQDMINNIMNLRRSLEMANRMKQEMEVENRILLEKSELDPLTKMANRFRLSDVSEEKFKGVTKAGGTFAIEILDVDYFKEFNDNYGHQAGDQCLREVAEAIKQVSGAHGGFCARYGGDEFIVIYEGLSKEDALNYAAELKAAVLGRKVKHEFSKAIPWVSVSQGLCWGQPQENMTLSDFLHTADDMLYKIKQVSRNNYCVGEYPSEGVECLVGPMGE